MSMCPDCKEVAAAVCEGLWMSTSDTAMSPQRQCAVAIRALPTKEPSSLMATGSEIHSPNTMEITGVQYRTLVWPAQCSCGHLFLERYVWKQPNENGEVGFSWCGFCRTRLPKKARFDKTACSQCGAEFGPGDGGYSHCESHRAGTQQNAAPGQVAIGASVETAEAVRTPAPDAAPGMPEEPELIRLWRDARFAKPGGKFPTLDYIDALHTIALAEHERAVRVAGERDEAQQNYRFMVERAANEKLEGYRELGAKCAAAEERAESAERTVAECKRIIDNGKAALKEEKTHADELRLLKESAERRVAELEGLLRETQNGSNKSYAATEDWHRRVRAVLAGGANVSVS